MCAEKRDKVGCQIQHIDQIPESIKGSDFHLVIEQPVKTKIDKDEQVGKHGNDIAELYPFDLMAFVIVIIILEIRQGLSVCSVEINDISNRLYQKGNEGHNADKGKILHVFRPV